MKVGVVLFMQNFADWDRFLGGHFDRPASRPDHEIVDEDLHLADLVEPLGFDSIWSLEHHFTPYTMVPDPLQFLAYCAARTRRVEFGTCVVVLPWHDPVRVAEQLAMLDIYAGGRPITIGFGRGAGRREFEGFRVPMSEARDRFVEALEVIKRALTEERFSFTGKYYQFPELSIRPRPRTQDMTSRLYAAAVSPSSIEVMANLGLGMLVIPQKSWQEHSEDLRTFNAIRERRGMPRVQSKVMVFVYCASSEKKAREEGLEYIGNYQDTAFHHYELGDPDHFRAAQGYEYYAQGADILKQLGASGQTLARDAFAQAHIWGTPEQCLEKLHSIQRITNAGELICVFKCGGMPLDKAEASMRLFARSVLPRIQAHEAK